MVKAFYSTKKVLKKKIGNKTFFSGGFSIERGGVLPAKMQQRTEVSVNLELIHFAHNSVCKKVLVSFSFIRQTEAWVGTDEYGRGGSFVIVESFCFFSPLFGAHA